MEKNKKNGELRGATEDSLKGSELDAAIAARVDLMKSEQARLLRELSSVGVHVQLVSDLNRWENKSYAHVLPILARHLHGAYSCGTLSSIARAMAMREAYPYWDELVSLYTSQPSVRPEGPGDFSMALGVAVSASFRPERMADLIDLLRTQGLRNRVLLLTPLRRRRSRDPYIAQVLEELRHDPDLSKEINSWKGMKKPLN